MALSAGSRLGPYEILAPLGAGGMGEVYRARDTRLGREVAIKVLPAAFSADADRLRRFELEARSASALNHPNILTIHDIGTHDGAPYVVSEVLEGETLRERLAGAALPARKAIDYAVQIAHGLAAAHEKGIVHRDLKPENLFVTKDGRVKILDFGLAKLVLPRSDSPALTKASTLTAGTQPGLVMGTVGYMSPEQLRGQEVDHRADIFAFGAILYEMLTGERAFSGASAADVMSAILQSEPEFAPLERDSATPEPIVRRCLEKNPEERFQSARDLAFALRESSGAVARGQEAVPRPPRSRGIPWPAAVGATVLLAVLLAQRSEWLRNRLGGADKPTAIRSLAVLPLENLSHDSGEEYFADGMTEALISSLARIRALRVISRTSVMRYKGARKAIPEIARELNVDGIVEGSVLRVGDRVRITAQLIHAGTERHLWAQDYERELHGILALQSEVARAIAREVHAKLTPEEQTRMAAAGPVNSRAHEAYLRGRYYWNKRTAAALLKGVEYFEQAIALDPEYAPAYAGVANCYVLLGGTGISAFSPNEVVPKAKAAALKALKIDDSLAEAHTALAYAGTTYDWDWRGSEKEFQRAIELDPGYPTAHFWYAVNLAARGRTAEAIEEARRARELDPLSPIIHAGSAWMAHLARRYEDAIEESRHALEIDPSFAIGHYRLGLAYERKNAYDDAIAEIQRAITSSGQNPDMIAALGHVFAVSGRRKDAWGVIERLKELRHRGYVSAYSFAAVHAGLAEKDRAFEWLQKALEERSWNVALLKVEPDMDSLRSDPRFEDLIRRIGLAI